MGHNDNDRDEARRYLGQALHQQVAAVRILEKKARTDDLNVRDGRVAFDPLDTASGRLALAVGDLIVAVGLACALDPPDPDPDPDPAGLRGPG